MCRCSLDDILTPALVVDEGRMTRNIDRMRHRVAELGVSFRPHVKTCKSLEIARRLMPTPRGPITVSTLKEAEQFFAHGVTDILYAVGIVPAKLPHVADLRARGCDLSVILDGAEAASGSRRSARTGAARFRCSSRSTRTITVAA